MSLGHTYRHTHISLESSHRAHFKRIHEVRHRTSGLTFHNLHELVLVEIGPVVDGGAGLAAFGSEIGAAITQQFVSTFRARRVDYLLSVEGADPRRWAIAGSDYTRALGESKSRHSYCHD